MGVSMCSLSRGEQANSHEFQYDREWTSDEQEDTDDDSEYFNLGKMGRGMSLPDLSALETVAPINRKKAEQVLGSRRNLSQDNMNYWNRSSVVNPEAELQAKLWCNTVANDTLKNLSHTVRIAGSIVETGAAITDELSRQDRLLSMAETDISVSKYETEQVAKTLKGMRCLRSKLNNVMWKKSPKRKQILDLDKTTSFNNMKLECSEEDMKSYAVSKTERKSQSVSQDTLGDIQQIQIKTGMGRLHNALDIMAMQQMDVAWALHTQEERLNMFEEQVTTTNEKINRQRRMVNRIMWKP